MRIAWVEALPSALGHSPASHYGAAQNAYAAWYTEHVDPTALFSQRYRFARAMVDQALALGWIPSEAPLPFADCTCNPTYPGSIPPGQTTTKEGQ